MRRRPRASCLGGSKAVLAAQPPSGAPETSTYPPPAWLTHGRQFSSDEDGDGPGSDGGGPTEAGGRGRVERARRRGFERGGPTHGGRGSPKKEVDAGEGPQADVDTTDVSREAREVLHQRERAGQSPISPGYWGAVVRWRSLPPDIRGGLLDPLVPRPSDRVMPSLAVGPANYRIATRPVDGGGERGEIRREFGPPSLLAAALTDDMADLASPSVAI